MERTIKTIIFISVFMACHFLMKDLWQPSWSRLLLTLDNDTKLLLKTEPEQVLGRPMNNIAQLVLKLWSRRLRYLPGQI